MVRVGIWVHQDRAKVDRVSSPVVMYHLLRKIFDAIVIRHPRDIGRGSELFSVINPWSTLSSGEPAVRELLRKTQTSSLDSPLAFTRAI